MITAIFLSALASSTTAPSAATSKPIVVTGRAIQEKKADLRTCVARHCPTDEDVNASLALAETQLLAGKYEDARATLLSSLGRNKRHADAYPIPVSDLYRANGRVAAHLGIDSDYYRSTWGIYNTLKRGLPGEIDRHYSAMMEVAEMMATTRGHDRAREYYRSIAHHAREGGRPDIAALAELRSIMRHWPAYAREKAIRDIAESNDPKTRAAQLEARLALARIALENNDSSKADAEIGELAQYKIKRPILVYSPPWAVGGGPANNDPNPSMQNLNDAIGTVGGASSGTVATGFSRSADPLDARSPYGGRAVSSTRMGINVRDMWLDVGFNISPDGRVSDVQVLRSKGHQGWSKPLLASIAGRRYTPPGDGAAIYRTERYTYTAGLEQGTASHQNQHQPTARVEYFDLSDIAASE